MNRFWLLINSPVHIAPLSVFRIIFGLVMLISTIRFWALGWIEDQYITPIFHFTYFGFEWVKPLNVIGMYCMFIVLGLSSIGVMLGFFYRLSAIILFLSFTYIELIDKAYYLNHYYFVSITAFLLTLVPAHRYFSIDSLRNKSLLCHGVPRWTIDIFKIQLALVYFFAGIAKINSTWLFDAMPLRLWLKAQDQLPLIGWMMPYDMTAYLFSWGGMIYDCTIVFFLLYNKTRPFAYLAVIGFHVVTGMMFPIGVFPIVMIGATTIFFSVGFHKKLLTALQSIAEKAFNVSQSVVIANPPNTMYQPKYQSLILTILAVHFSLQLILPFRYLAYPNNLFWTEEGYRFSWRVMLAEKAGTAIFYVKDSASGREGVVVNSDFLNPTQEKQMSFQPDMILEFAHFLHSYYANQGLTDPEVRAEVYCTLNGRPGKLLIDPSINLAKEKEGFHHKTWIMPFDSSPTLSRNQ